MTFADAMRNETTLKTTENGAMAYNTLDDAILDLYAIGGALRKRDDAAIRAKFASAYNESPILAFLLAVYIRDIRAGGLGERRTGRIGLRYIASKQPDFFAQNIKQIALECGRGDDIYEYLGVNSTVDAAIWSFIKTTLAADLKNMKAGKPITLLAKWLKSANASSAETKRLGKQTAKECGLTLKQYRTALSALRKYSNVVEVKMSAREWNSIDFETVPSYAMKNYRNAFRTHVPEAFTDFIGAVEKGEKTIKASTLYPYDLLEQYLGWNGPKTEDAVIEAQWKALPNYIEGDNNVLIMADVSGSMTGRPMATSIGLAIYFAERNTGAFADMFMTFSGRPEYVRLDRNDSLRNRAAKAIRANWQMNTNLDAAFEKVLNTATINRVPASQMPKAIVVISDMEIDGFGGSMGHGAQDIYGKWYSKFAAAGYQLPKTIWWNVDSRQDTFLTKDKNTLCVSGQSAATFKTVLKSLDKTMIELVIDTLKPYGEDYDWSAWRK